jgi:DNA recombination protein RmuC
MAVTISFVVSGLLFVLGSIVGFLLGRHAWPIMRGADPADLKAAQLEAARLGERVAMLERQLAERSELESHFENIANRVLKSKASELSDGSQRELAAVLEPLRQRIEAFQSKVETTYQSETREVLSLKEQVRLLVETSHAVGSQADGLAKALRGDSQVLGRWGDLKLERILETAGLTEGREFISQGRGLGLRNEEGGLQRPDIIIMLPEQRTMIIDSKVSLASYERLIAASDENERAAYGGQLVRDVKAHIDGLAGKRYQDNDKLRAHDCVLMFVPIEPALAAALTKDPELFYYAWNRHVVLVSPSILLMTVQTVASIWRYERQGQNTQEIARLAGELIDKVTLSLADLNTVTTKLSDAAAAHNEAVKKLATGKGNAMSIGGRIRTLGVKTKRPAPAILVDGGMITESEWADGKIPVIGPNSAVASAAE